jgi:hypothetical protein
MILSKDISVRFSLNLINVKKYTSSGLIPVRPDSADAEGEASSLFCQIIGMKQNST